MAISAFYNLQVYCGDVLTHLRLRRPEGSWSKNSMASTGKEKKSKNLF
jgi:hypothetical protein